MVQRPRWNVLNPDLECVRALAEHHDLRDETARILVNRGITDVDAAGRFLNPRLSELRPPTGMAGFERAVARLEEALLAGEVIGVFGDYDVDGATSAALLTSFFRSAGAARVEARVAARSRGYGFSVADAGTLHDLGCSIIVTCDCGTSDAEALAFARQAGVDVIVVDHHHVPDGESLAYAMINPHQPGCSFPFKGLASVGVGFYLAAALKTQLCLLGRQLDPNSDAGDPRRLLDLVAVGTIADQAPLCDENRILVTHGLRWLGHTERPGLRALMDIAELDPNLARTEVDVAFRMAPRLNAPGRLGDAQPSLELLLATSEADGRRWAQGLDEANRERQRIEQEVCTQAFEEATLMPLPNVLVVARQGWHPGVLGIVAAKLVERFGRPSIVVGLEGEQGRGSARSCGGFHLVDGMRACAEHLVRFGGHAGAAGITIRADEVSAFSAAIDRVAREQLAGQAAPGLAVDAMVPLERVDTGLAAEIARLRPFGMGNKEPLFSAEAHTLRSRVVGRDHLKLVLAGADRSATYADGSVAGPTREAIAFRMAERDPGPNASIDVVFVPEIDHFRGVARLQLRVRDIRPT